MSSNTSWHSAAALARILTPPGPNISLSRAQRTVSQLRWAAVEVEELSARLLGLPVTRVPVRVVDRSTWIATLSRSIAAVNGLGSGTLPSLQTGAATLSWGRGTRFLQQTVSLGRLSMGNIGHFNPLADSAEGMGEILLVAPNFYLRLAHSDADARDLATWVLLQKNLYATLFNARPWLWQKCVSLLFRIYCEGPSEPELAADTKRARTGWRMRQIWGLSKQEVLPVHQGAESELVYLLSLIGGYTRSLLDQITPAYMPSVQRIREGIGAQVDLPALAVLALPDTDLSDMSARVNQTRLFFRAAHDCGGAQALSLAWERAENLPLESELSQLQAWLDRLETRDKA